MNEHDAGKWLSGLVNALANVPQAQAVALSFVIAFLRLAYQGRRWERRLLEALLCSALTVAASSILAALGAAFDWKIPAEAVVGVGGLLAFIGVDELRELATRYLKKRVGDE